MNSIVVAVLECLLTLGQNIKDEGVILRGLEPKLELIEDPILYKEYLEVFERYQNLPYSESNRLKIENIINTIKNN